MCCTSHCLEEWLESIGSAVRISIEDATLEDEILQEVTTSATTLPLDVLALGKTRRAGDPPIWTVNA